MRLVNWLSTLLQDVRYGIRSLRRNPFLSGAIVLTLSLGIGLNVGVFTLINAMLFRASVDKDPDTFIRIYAEYSDRFVQGAVNLADYRAYLSGTHSLVSRNAFNGRLGGLSCKYITDAKRALYAGEHVKVASEGSAVPDSPCFSSLSNI
jgi:hypothetical protein